ncbi:hypothetical protein KFE25_008540 [Diacronema lutheri]|uniref:Methyltransferase domain-containing protein n=1 Tax=Diacronema lutheri TaxID=2081491 RepID=A0A8J5Y2M8_DIALT|nr:hypothetical protein KFE25_008540 [Diacronema lutheri]
MAVKRSRTWSSTFLVLSVVGARATRATTSPANVLLVRSLPWARSPTWVADWLHTEVRERSGISPVSLEVVLRKAGPRRLADGTEQLHTGTAIVRFASEAESLRALELFSAALSGFVLHAELLREEPPVERAPRAADARADGAAPRLLAARRREHQRNRRGREHEQLDLLLARVERRAGHLAVESAPPRARRIDWEALPPALDPCNSARRMLPGTMRGERKRLTVEVFAQLLDELLPGALARESARGAAIAQPTAPLTLVDCGSGTGNLLLPLAALSAPGVEWVGIDMKHRSVQLLEQRITNASTHLPARVRVWAGLIDEYAGPCDAVLSLHACGGASDAALALAARRGVPYIVSPCCVGKLRRGPRSGWLAGLLGDGASDGPGGESTFASIAACADAASPGADALVRSRRARAKLVVEQDRLAAAREGGGAECRLIDMGLGGADEVEVALGSSHLRHVLVGRFPSPAS